MKAHIFNALTPDARARALYYYFGWQGGTIHQLAAATGLTAADILSRPHDGSRLTGGFSAIRTCEDGWRRDTLAPKHQGDWPYWRDAISGFWATEPLDGGEAPAVNLLAAMRESAFRAGGYSIVDTGGGCTAWRRDLGAGRYVLITGADGCDHEAGEGESFLIGLHSEDGAELGEVSDTAPDADSAIAAATRLAGVQS